MRVSSDRKLRLDLLVKVPQRESLGVMDTPTEATCQIQIEAITYEINKVVLNFGTTKRLNANDSPLPQSVMIQSVLRVFNLT